MLIDSHAHLNFKAFEKDLDQVIKRCQENDIFCVNVGTKYETSKRAVEIAEKNKGMYASIGLHPVYLGLVKIKTDPEEGNFEPKGEDFDLEKYKDLAKSDKVVAIGEMGLDYYYRPKGKNKLSLFKEKQKNILIKQLNLAEELDLPVIFHCRMAHQDLISVLKNYRLQTTNYLFRGVIHCFTGDWEEAKEYLDMGYYLGFNGIIYKLDLREVIEKTPLDGILIETDCPYLTPSLAKEKRNEPIFIKYIIQDIAKIKNLNFQQVADATAQNAKNLFGI